MYKVRHDFIAYLLLEEELDKVMIRYEENYVPGCGGSVDVLHVKLSNCWKAPKSPVFCSTKSSSSHFHLRLSQD